MKFFKKINMNALTLVMLLTAEISHQEAFTIGLEFDSTKLTQTKSMTDSTSTFSFTRPVFLSETSLTINGHYNPNKDSTELNFIDPSSSTLSVKKRHTFTPGGGETGTYTSDSFQVDSNTVEYYVYTKAKLTIYTYSVSSNTFTVKDSFTTSTALKSIFKIPQNNYLIGFGDGKGFRFDVSVTGGDFKYFVGITSLEFMVNVVSSRDIASTLMISTKEYETSSCYMVVKDWSSLEGKGETELKSSNIKLYAITANDVNKRGVLMGGNMGTEMLLYYYDFVSKAKIGELQDTHTTTNPYFLDHSFNDFPGTTMVFAIGYDSLTEPLKSEIFLFDMTDLSSISNLKSVSSEFGGIGSSEFVVMSIEKTRKIFAFAGYKRTSFSTDNGSDQGIVQIFKIPSCHSSCTTCLTKEDQSKCTGCPTDFKIEGGGTEGKCILDCYQNCQTCSEAFTETKCTSCFEGYHLTEGVEGKCSKDAAPICSDSNCATCSINSKGEKFCVSCKTGFDKNDEGVCFVDNSGTCHKSCGECSERGIYGCITCSSDFPSNIFEVYNGRCQCKAEGHYNVFPSPECLPCHESCKYCEGPEESQCTVCQSETALVLRNNLSSKAGTCFDCSLPSNKESETCKKLTYNLKDNTVVISQEDKLKREREESENNLIWKPLERKYETLTLGIKFNEELLDFYKTVAENKVFEEKFLITNGVLELKKDFDISYILFEKELMLQMEVYIFNHVEVSGELSFDLKPTRANIFYDNLSGFAKRTTAIEEQNSDQNPNGRLLTSSKPKKKGVKKERNLENIEEEIGTPLISLQGSSTTYDYETRSPPPDQLQKIMDIISPLFIYISILFDVFLIIFTFTKICQKKYIYVVRYFKLKLILKLLTKIPLLNLSFSPFSLKFLDKLLTSDTYIRIYFFKEKMTIGFKFEEYLLPVSLLENFPILVIFMVLITGLSLLWKKAWAKKFIQTLIAACIMDIWFYGFLEIFNRKLDQSSLFGIISWIVTLLLLSGIFSIGYFVIKKILKNEKKKKEDVIKKGKEEKLHEEKWSFMKEYLSLDYSSEKKNMIITKNFNLVTMIRSITLLLIVTITQAVGSKQVGIALVLNLICLVVVYEGNSQNHFSSKLAGRFRLISEFILTILTLLLNCLAFKIGNESFYIEVVIVLGIFVLYIVETIPFVYQFGKLKKKSSEKLKTEKIKIENTEKFQKKNYAKIEKKGKIEKNSVKITNLNIEEKKGEEEKNEEKFPLEIAQESERNLIIRRRKKNLLKTKLLEFHEKERLKKLGTKGSDENDIEVINLSDLDEKSLKEEIPQKTEQIDKVENEGKLEQNKNKTFKKSLTVNQKMGNHDLNSISEKDTAKPRRKFKMGSLYSSKQRGKIRKDEEKKISNSEKKDDVKPRRIFKMGSLYSSKFRGKIREDEGKKNSLNIFSKLNRAKMKVKLLGLRNEKLPMIDENSEMKNIKITNNFFASTEAKKDEKKQEDVIRNKEDQPPLENKEESENNKMIEDEKKQEPPLENKEESKNSKMMKEEKNQEDGIENKEDQPPLEKKEKSENNEMMEDEKKQEDEIENKEEKIKITKANRGQDEEELRKRFNFVKKIKPKEPPKPNYRYMSVEEGERLRREEIMKNLMVMQKDTRKIFEKMIGFIEKYFKITSLKEKEKLAKSLKNYAEFMKLNKKSFESFVEKYVYFQSDKDKECIDELSGKIFPGVE